MSLRFSEMCVDALDAAALAHWWSQALGWPVEAAEDDVGTRRLRKCAEPQSSKPRDRPRRRSAG